MIAVSRTAPLVAYPTEMEATIDLEAPLRLDDTCRPGTRWIPRGGRAAIRGVPAVQMRQSAILALHTHLLGDLENERGGFLVGRLGAAFGDHRRVRVDAYVPALSAAGSPTSLVIPPADFFAVHAALDRAPGALIVGWAHSHPGLGVFLSHYDRFLWDSFFAEKHQVAVVVDPVNGQGAVFGRLAGERGTFSKAPLTEVHDVAGMPVLTWSNYRRR